MFIFFRSAMLRSPNDPPDGGQGGGGGGGTGGTGESGDGLLTDAQLAQVAAITNKAVTSQLNRVLPKALDDFGTKFSASLDEKLAKMAPPESDGDSGGGKDKSKENPFQKQLEALANDVEKERKARIEAENARNQAERDRKMDAAVAEFRAGLEGKVQAELLGPAVELFSKKILTIDDDGKVLMTVQRAPYKGAPLEDEKVSIQEGLKEFLSSEQLKPFLPAPGGAQGGGSGGGKRPVQRNGGSTGSTDEDKVWRDLETNGISADDLL